MELISCTDYVLKKGKEQIHFRSISSHIQFYAEFLKQPLTLGMFIPTDKEGNVLEKCNDSCIEGFDCPCFNNGTKQQYQEALDRVLFEGFTYKRTPTSECANTGHGRVEGYVETIVANDKRVYYKHFHNNKLGESVDWEYKIIEDLTSLGLTLTPNAIKLING